MPYNRNLYLKLTLSRIYEIWINLETFYLTLGDVGSTNPHPPIGLVGHQSVSPTILNKAVKQSKNCLKFVSNVYGTPYGTPYGLVDSCYREILLLPCVFCCRNVYFGTKPGEKRKKTTAPETFHGEILRCLIGILISSYFMVYETIPIYLGSIIPYIA